MARRQPPLSRAGNRQFPRCSCPRCEFPRFSSGVLITTTESVRTNYRMEPMWIVLPCHQHRRGAATKVTGSIRCLWDLSRGEGHEMTYGQDGLPDQYPQPNYEQQYRQGNQPWQPPQHRKRSRAPLYAGIAAVVVIAGAATAYALAGHGSNPRAVSLSGPM